MVRSYSWKKSVYRVFNFNHTDIWKGHPLNSGKLATFLHLSYGNFYIQHSGVTIQSNIKTKFFIQHVVLDGRILAGDSKNVFNDLKILIKEFHSNSFEKNFSNSYCGMRSVWQSRRISQKAQPQPLLQFSAFSIGNPGLLGPHGKSSLRRFQSAFGFISLQWPVGWQLVPPKKRLSQLRGKHIHSIEFHNRKFIYSLKSIISIFSVQYCFSLWAFLQVYFHKRELWHVY